MTSATPPALVVSRHTNSIGPEREERRRKGREGEKGEKRGRESGREGDKWREEVESKRGRCKNGGM